LAEDSKWSRANEIRRHLLLELDENELQLLMRKFRDNEEDSDYERLASRAEEALRKGPLKDAAYAKAARVFACLTASLFLLFFTSLMTFIGLQFALL